MVISFQLVKYIVDLQPESSMQQFHSHKVNLKIIKRKLTKQDKQNEKKKTITCTSERYKVCG